jgi:hypothetical protein
MVSQRPRQPRQRQFSNHRPQHGVRRRCHHQRDAQTGHRLEHEFNGHDTDLCKRHSDADNGMHEVQVDVTELPAGFDSLDDAAAGRFVRQDVFRYEEDSGVEIERAAVIAYWKPD